MLKLKPQNLEDEINKEIDDMLSKPFIEDSKFAIHNVSDIQVQVIVTRNEDEQLDQLTDCVEDNE